MFKNEMFRLFRTQRYFRLEKSFQKFVFLPCRKFNNTFFLKHGWNATYSENLSTSSNSHEESPGSKGNPSQGLLDQTRSLFSPTSEQIPPQKTSNESSSKRTSQNPSSFENLEPKRKFLLDSLKKTAIWIGSFCFIFLICRLIIVICGSGNNDNSTMTDLSIDFNKFIPDRNYRPVKLTDKDIDFSHICGCDEAKQELVEIVEFLKEPEKFIDLGAELPKGVLLVGPPGCGKTLLAKAIAKEAGINFFSTSGSEFEEILVGVGSKRIRELFTTAKTCSPSIIFIDEIDALGSKRGLHDSSSTRMSLNQLLVEMDGFHSSDKIIVIGATNTPEALDAALTRPGRFDLTVSLDPPDLKGRTEVLDLYLKRIKYDPSILASSIAQGTPGFTGAELRNIINIAAIQAALKKHKLVTQDDLEYAKDRILLGAASKKILPENDRRITAYHEGGHALLALLLENEGAHPVYKATIVPRGRGILGLVMQQPSQDCYSQSKRECLTRLKICLAGRAAEELIFGADDITTGASSDFEKATQLAQLMVRRFGFTDTLGVIDFSYSSSSNTEDMSNSTKELIDSEVKNLLKDAYEQTKTLLFQNRDKLDSIATSLLARETLTSEELKQIMMGKVLPPLQNFQN